MEHQIWISSRIEAAVPSHGIFKAKHVPLGCCHAPKDPRTGFRSDAELLPLPLACYRHLGGVTSPAWWADPAESVMGMWKMPPSRQRWKTAAERVMHGTEHGYFLVFPGEGFAALLWCVWGCWSRSQCLPVWRLCLLK